MGSPNPKRKNNGPKIVLVGAGSTVFAKNLLGDILSFEALAGSHLSLFDIDQERLNTSKIVAHKVAEATGAKPHIEATLDRRAALDGADFVISMFQVGGYRPCTVTDFEVPKRYGVEQTIADTLGIGGIMRGLRTIPVFQAMHEEMAALCPDVTHLNYVNPMVMNCRAIARTSKVRTIGLCHSVQHTAADLAQDIGVPIEEVDYLCAGINHMAFYLKFERAGQDLYPALRKLAQDGPIPSRGHAGRADGGVVGLSDAVRYKVLESFGYFVTESSEHFSEYVPWFIKPGREDLLKRFEIPIDEYLRRCEHQLAGWHAMKRDLEDRDLSVTVERSDEYGASIIHSVVTGERSLVYGNVPNQGYIDNLPQDAIVEVPCHIDEQGIHPQAVGSLPPQLSALMQTNLNVHELTVEAALTGKREHIYHAALLDPHTAAVLGFDDIHRLVDELIEAHGDYIPEALR